MARQSIIPFFIPMEGCPHRCIFCDQVAISGKSSLPKAADISAALGELAPDSGAEAAFYGGSFTCLSRERQAYYLDAAGEALAAGRIGGIRISTRPDAIDGETCVFLRKKGVVTVELGIQSFDDEVLRLSQRGYKGETAAAACRAVVASGLRLGVQLMTGLPGDRRELDVAAVRQAGELGARLLRIYPTLVLEHTPLAELYRQGSYVPQELKEAVKTAAAMCAVARAREMTLIRVGINTSADVEESLVAGPYHPAFGGLVKEELKQAQLAELLDGLTRDDVAALFFPANELPLIFGDKRGALRRLAVKYPSLAFIPDDGLPPGLLRLEVGGRTEESREDDFCRRFAARL